MRIKLASVAAFALLSFTTLGAQAMPLAPLAPGATADVTLVEGGCGPGAFRDVYGRCRVREPVVVAPVPGVVVVEPRVCGPGFRWHPGWRRCIRL